MTEKHVQIATKVLLVLILIPILIALSCGSRDQWILLSQSEGLHAVGYSDVVFFDDNSGIVAAMGDIKKSKDGGRSWTTVFQRERSVVSSFSVSGKRIWAVGSDEKIPVVYFSDDRGDNWHTSILSLKQNMSWGKNFSLLYRLCFDENGKAWFVGNGGIIETQVNGDDFDVISITDTDWPVYDVAQSGHLDKSLVFVGGQATVFRNLVQSKIQPTSDDVNLFRIRFFDGQIWIVGGSDKDGLLYRSRDNGLSWESKAPPGSPPMFDMYLSSKRGLLVGRGGAIFTTNDGGNTWTEQPSPTKNDLQTIFFRDPLNIWIVGDKGTVLRSSGSDLRY